MPDRQLPETVHEDADAASHQRPTSEEVGIEPLLSPSHLLLAFSGILILSSPLRAAWRRADSVASHGWGTLLPALLSLLAVFSIFTFFTEFAHPLVHPRRRMI